MNTGRARALTQHGQLPAEHSRGEFEVIVVFTNPQSTLRALKTAGSLAKGLGAHIRLLVPHLIAFPVPLEERLVGTAFLERRFRTVVAGVKVDTRVDVRLCRTRWQMLLHVLEPRSVVVLGGRRRWWQSAESRLARKLRAAGHHVVLSLERRKDTFPRWNLTECRNRPIRPRLLAEVSLSIVGHSDGLLLSY